MSTQEKIQLKRQVNVLVFNDDTAYCTQVVNNLEAYSEQNVQPPLYVESAVTEDEALRLLKTDYLHWDVVICDACPDEKNQASPNILMTAKENHDGCQVLIFTCKAEASALQPMYIAAGADDFLASVGALGSSVFDDTDEFVDFYDVLIGRTMTLVQRAVEMRPYGVVTASFSIEKNQPVWFWPSVARFMVDLINAVDDQMDKQGKDKSEKPFYARHISLINDEMKNLKGFTLERDKLSDGTYRDREDKAINNLIELITKMGGPGVVQHLPKVLTNKRGSTTGNQKPAKKKRAANKKTG